MATSKSKHIRKKSKLRQQWKRRLKRKKARAKQPA
jgi:hypothetical protein